MTKETEISNETSPEVQRLDSRPAQRNTSETHSVCSKNGKVTVQMPLLVCSSEFAPTPYMMKYCLAWIESVQEGTELTPAEICQAIGCSRNVYYYWRKKPAFEKWMQAVLEEFYGTTGLQRVYRACFRRAVGNSPQDTKMYLERFDKLYKPATAQEHSLAGIRPPDEDVEAAIAASKAREPVESTDITVVQQDDKQGIA